MRRNLLTLILSFALFSGFAQSHLNGSSYPEIKKEKLLTAKLISDIIPNCPTHWKEILNYESINVMAISDGKILEEESTDEKLTVEQKRILSQADKGSELLVKVRYRWKDQASAQGDYGQIHVMRYKVLITPETEAEKLVATTAFLKSINYQVHGKYISPLKKEKLSEAKLITDIIPGYSNLWIKGYVSVEILTSCDGKIKKAESANGILTQEQKTLLSNVEHGADVFVNAFYQYQNPVTGEIQTGPTHFSATVVPEIEAEYFGGYKELTNYLMDNAITKIPEPSVKPFNGGTVRFTVSEAGEIVNAKILRTTGYQKIDDLLLEAINKMPKWKPAENAKGVKIKQDFEFNVGRSFGYGGGC